MTRLIHGDCLEHLDYLEPGSVGLILCQLPDGSRCVDAEALRRVVLHGWRSM